MSQFLPEEPIPILSAQSDKLIVKYTLPLWNFASNFIVMHDEIIYSNNQSVEVLNVETKKLLCYGKMKEIQMTHCLA